MGMGAKRDLDGFPSQMTFEHSKAHIGKSKAKLSLAVFADNIEAFPVYEEFDDDCVLVTFCVHYSLYTDDASNSNYLEVNFLETPVKLRHLIKCDFATVLTTSEETTYTQ